MYTFTLVDKKDIHTRKKKIIPREDFSKLMKASEILDQAKEEAKKIIDETLVNCEEIKAQAKQEGFEEGLTQFNQHILYLEDQIKALRHDMQKAILPLVLRSTKRIIGEELEINPQSVVHIVMQAIKSVSQCRHVRLFVNKGDLDNVEAEKSKIRTLFEHLETFQIESSPDVAKGGLIIETEKGILNATLETQFRALERAMESYKKG